MKQLTLIGIIILLFFTFTAMAGSAKKYGKTLTLKKVTKISTILEKPEKYNGKKVLVEGTIVEVCAKRGCWIEIASDKEFESIRFKVEDGVMTFPIDAKGKKVKAEGTFSMEVVSKEELIEQGKKHAKESGEKFDPATITEEKTYIQIDGIGAEVK
ncbi:MAG: DUF4920 domain-containing protein [Ignavibacteriales bacterium]|nr:DUF4920 domain-containing protein [Ignavibacteriales bacterium]